MFWGLLLKANKRYSQVVQKDFHISHATLDVNSDGLGDEDIIQVWVQADDANHLLCNLDKRSSHVALDLTFSEGETIAFFSKGSGVVHLTGFLSPDDPDYGFDGLGEEELEDEQASDEEISTSKKGKSKALANALAGEDDDEDDSELDEDELLSDDDELDEEEGEEEEDEEMDADEEEISSPPAKQAKVEKSTKQQNGLPNGKAATKNEQIPKKKKDKKEKPQQQTVNQSQPTQPQQKAKTALRTLSAGVVVEDLRPGKGPEAKTGRKVSVYYEGRLKANNKIFDSTKAGDGFKFTLGRGEVIRGWDIGVVGMKVGGKRRITLPPNVAYGPKGQPPAIPGNSTLVFDVELRGVN